MQFLSQEEALDANLYGRPTSQARRNEETSGTIVAGYSNSEVKNKQVEDEDEKAPIVGFLYSISKKGYPEYWPLRLGRNLIGRSTDCDIRLNESSVSAHHATISIKMLRKSNKLMATVRDVGSKSGLLLNNEELDYDGHSCANEDVITIGEHYQLLFLLVDPSKYGLKPDDDFKEASSSVPSAQLQSPTHDLYDSSLRIEDGTIDLSGMYDDDNEAGHTKVM